MGYFMQSLFYVFLATSALLIGGCTSFVAPDFAARTSTSSQPDRPAQRRVTFEKFASNVSAANANEVMCRQVGPIKTPGGGSFAEYLHSIFVQEFSLAASDTEGPPVMLTGSIITFDHGSIGWWKIGVDFKSSNGNEASIETLYRFHSNWYGNKACELTANALLPAARSLVTRALESPGFVKLTQ